ncbi:MAG TPA: acetoacetate decarboxylase [Burkholderiaceae bacterium]|nr:acetoacetate decarboxylase [Burkholderiaceae bacterium]
MNADDVRRTAWAMPLTSPSYPRGPYRFVDREFLVISYRTDPAALAALVPEPLMPAGDVVRFEFIRMPDSTGFGDYTESGQVIPVSFEGRQGVYVHSMYLDDDAPIAGGREIWGFPKKLGSPKLRVDKDTLLGTLAYGSTRIAVGTMGYKHRSADRDAVLRSLVQPNWLLKIMPDVDCSPRVCELVEYRLEDVTLKGAWEGPAALQLFEHALAPVARLPVLQVLGGLHLSTDLTLGLGRVVHDYLTR